jgi:CheY-like chemotaxis protein
MSHEIRTPMTAILGFAEMLLHKSPAECTEAGCAQIIRRNSLHLLELINDILDLSKVEAGQMTVEAISFDLPAVLSEIVSLLRPRATDKGLSFDVTFQGPIPNRIQSDPTRFKQILLNLLGNAFKFTESGRVEMRITNDGAGGPNIRIRVDIIDSGIGMTKEQLQRLFQPFTQAAESITRKYGGTGLGLTISRHLARLLNGDIIAASQPNIGSTFTLTLDGGPSAGVQQLQGLTELTMPKKVDQSAAVQADLHGRILLVEDGMDNQRLLRMQLGNAGASVVSALNGQIAVDLATTQPFDLILMDMQMPIKDGYAATIELRRSGITIPIIALTAYAMAEDREKCLASGCTGYLSKPIEEATLLETVNANLRNTHLEPAGPAPLAADTASNQIKSSLAGNPRMMEIIPAFVERLGGKVHTMIDLLEKKDLPALQRAIHDLVGTAGGYGFGFITQPARKVEQAIKAGNPLEAITGEFKSLLELIRRIDGYEEIKMPAVVDRQGV